MLSIIITAHNEGLMAHHTMLSIFRAIEVTNEKYEIIVHIDNGDDETIRYFSRYADDRRIRILQNDFGDLGMSRNFAIEKAKGEYISVLDADDLVSKNYFVETMRILRGSDEEVIVHPNYCLSFEDLGGNFVLQTLGESINPEMDAILLFGRHRWIAAVSGRRETFLNTPYTKTENGFGHEDYTLNIKLTERGVLHKIAKDTTYFYRRKAFSLLQQSNSQHYAQPYHELFDIEKWQQFRSLEKDVIEPPKTWSQRLRDGYVKIRNNKFLNFFITPVAEVSKKITGKRVIQPTEMQVPASLLEEWMEISKIENQMFPTTEILATRLTKYNTDTIEEVSQAYYKICKQVKHKPDFVFVVPWVVSGGADKVLLNYLNALEEIHPDWHVAVITTNNCVNEWRHRMPHNSFLVEFGKAAENLDRSDRDILLTRTLIQLQCLRIHVINSAEILEWVRLHQSLVKNQFDISASLFCYGILAHTDGRGIWDFADPYITRIYDLINAFYTDNNAVIDYLVKKEGFDKEKFRVHYQPTPQIAHQDRHYAQEPKKLNILWAGRISVQKNPKLLVRIAEKLDPEKVHIDAYGRFDEIERDGFQFPEDSGVLSYCGPFDDFSKLDLDKYDLFLHTSVIDGMPNIVLEAASAGLVTVAGDVGGIGDFVKNDKTGFLITDADNEECYVEIIDKIQQDPSMLNSMIKEAQKLLHKRYAWEPFVEDIRRDFVA